MHRTQHAGLLVLMPAQLKTTAPNTFCTCGACFKNLNCFFPPILSLLEKKLLLTERKDPGRFTCAELLTANQG